MTVRWGILGCGDVAEVKSGPGFQNCRDSRLTAVMRRTGDLAADYARRHGVSRWYDDAQALIDDPEVDAVYVATPPGSHFHYALSVCQAGKPAYVEKPMARTYEECQAMVRAFREAGLKLFVAYYRRALPRFLKVKELLDAGALGTVTGVTYRFSKPPAGPLDRQRLPWRLNAEESGGGLFFDLGSHALDILDFLLGPLDEAAGLHFRTNTGVPGVASWDFAGSATADGIEIVGTAGSVRLSVFGNEPVQWTGPGGVETFDLPNPRHIQQPLIQTIVDELLGRGVCPSTGETGARTSRVMDAAVVNYYGTRSGSFWQDPSQWPGHVEKATRPPNS